MTAFHVVVTGRNAGPWIYECLESIGRQGDHQVSISIVDDASEDASVAEIEMFMAVSCFPDVQLTVNRERRGALHNQWLAINALEGGPQDVVVIVDADDRLAHDQVFDILAGYYDEDLDLVLTYGGYRPEPVSATCARPRPYPDWVADQRAFRRFTGQGNLLFNHLRTFRLGAFRKVDPVRNFRWGDGGAWFNVCADTAIMIPLLEIAGRNYRCLDQVLYVYNSANPSSDWRQSAAEIDRTHHYILNRLPSVMA